MINSIKIPNNISFKLLKNKLNETKYIIILNNISLEQGNNELFLVSDSEIYYNNRIVISNKYTINLIKQGIKNLLLWNKRKIVLKGVGSKSELIDGYLHMKVSNTSKSFKIPLDINIKIKGNIINIWGKDKNLIDKFKNKILSSFKKMK